MVSIRAVYRDGQLRPLDPVDLQDGDEVQIQIAKSSPVRLVDVVSDLLVPFDDAAPAIDEAALQVQLDAALQGQRPLSEIVIEERRQGR